MLIYTQTLLSSLPSGKYNRIQTVKRGQEIEKNIKKNLKFTGLKTENQTLAEQSFFHRRAFSLRFPVTYSALKI